MRMNVADVYFYGANDANLNEFTGKFLADGLFWIYIALHPQKDWSALYKSLSDKDRPLFRREYNKAFALSRSFKELTKLIRGKDITLKNLFLPKVAVGEPDRFVTFTRADELRWKEALELTA